MEGFQQEKSPPPTFLVLGRWQVLQDDIMPALEKLRKEKAQYNEWQTARDSVDKLCRFCVAFTFVEAQK